MKENVDKINRKMTRLEKIFSKTKTKSPFLSNLHKELLPTKNKGIKPKGKIDKGKKTIIERKNLNGSKNCSKSTVIRECKLKRDTTLHQIDWQKLESWIKPSTGKDVSKQEPSCIASRNIN